MSPFPRNPVVLELSKTIDPKECLELLGVSISYLRLIGYGHKRCSAKTATQLELNTNGKVTRKALRPNDWHLIWPEII